MAISINDAARNTMADALADAFDSGSNTLSIYTGSAPAVGDAATGTLLAQVTLPTPAFGAASSGAVSKSGTWADNSIDATGTAGYFRYVAASGEVIQGTVTATSGGGDMEVDDTSFVAGGTFTVTSASLTVPAS